MLLKTLSSTFWKQLLLISYNKDVILVGDLNPASQIWMADFLTTKPPLPLAIPYRLSNLQSPVSEMDIILLGLNCSALLNWMEQVNCITMEWYNTHELLTASYTNIYFLFYKSLHSHQCYIHNMKYLINYIKLSKSVKVKIVS